MLKVSLVLEEGKLRKNRSNGMITPRRRRRKVSRGDVGENDHKYR